LAHDRNAMQIKDLLISRLSSSDAYGTVTLNFVYVLLVFIYDNQR